MPRDQLPTPPGLELLTSTFLYFVHFNQAQTFNEGSFLISHDAYLAIQGE